MAALPSYRVSGLSARSRPPCAQRRVSASLTSCSLRSDLSAWRPRPSGSSESDFHGAPMTSAVDALNRVKSSGSSRSVVTMVIPFQRGAASRQPPPDISSFIFKERIIYLGMPFIPAVTELIIAELFHLAYEDRRKPIYMYINSTGITKNGEKLGFETEAFAIHDVMRHIGVPIYTLAIGNAWGEAALLLAAGTKGHRAALPSAKIMIREPFGRFRGQATDIDIQRREMTVLKETMLKLYSRYMVKSEEEIAADIRRPKYFTPEEAVEYGIIDRVLSGPKKDAESILRDFQRSKQII